MSLAWSGVVADRSSCNLGPLAVVAPLLERMDVAAIIDRHLPPDPQLEFTHGQVLSTLLAARLCQPLALVNVAAWAEESGFEFLGGVPADKLNDDRLGRALDAFFTQRHSILGSVAAHVVHTFRLPMERLHYDTTHLIFYGAYDSPPPAASAKNLPLPPATASANFPAARISHGYAVSDAKMIHAGVCSAVDDLGAVPIVGHTLDGNDNGRTGIAQQFELLQNYLQPQPFLMISDRGTFSTGHVARLHRAGHAVLCSVPWCDFRSFFDQHRACLFWNSASFLSVEQRRRRDCNSSLPKEHHELAVLRHQLTDPETGELIACRLIFVFSSADQKICQQNRAKTIAKIRAGLEDIARSVASGHHRSQDPAAMHRRVAKLLGSHGVARHFRWELVPLSLEEQAALPAPQRGCRRPTHRFVFSYDEKAAEADAAHDGYSCLLTTSPLTLSADTLFCQFKQQCYVEHAHHQWKTPLAVRPLFLKAPERVEALVYLLKIALTAYHLLQRLYRQAVPDNEPRAEQRLTAESILRAFRLCPMIKEQTRLGVVVHPLQSSRRQRHILNRLGFPTPAQTISRRLPRYPPQ